MTPYQCVGLCSEGLKLGQWSGLDGQGAYASEREREEAKVIAFPAGQF